MTHKFTAMLGSEEITIETGKFAEQASASVTVQQADTMVFGVVMLNKNARAETDFFPLSVDYEEKMYAAGRIPSSFFRREGKPSEGAILIGRLTDRAIRPLFPKFMRNEVQVVLNAFSHDQVHHIDILGITAASAALMISEIPWDGPVAGVRIGMVNGEFIVNPTINQMENSVLDLRVAGTRDAINMVECGAEEVTEEVMIAALMLAHQSIQPLIDLQIQMREQLGKAKVAIVEVKPDEALNHEVSEKTLDAVRDILVNKTDRTERAAAMDALKANLLAEYAARNAALAEGQSAVSLKMVEEALEDVMKGVVRNRILEEGIRPDGRGLTQLRQLSAEVGVIPRVHGSGLFQRGQTQVLTIATLGTPRDSQNLDGLFPEDTKRYLHHYNFPPYSTGETGRIGSPRRREIGHGALAETALRSMIPDEKSFPYTIRLVSEVMSSNGSTSMASVCGSTLALMDAGVPIKQPVAGIAMGLIKDDEAIAVLTDIQGLEDHLGDMDFKVAGTRNGITALQMDIKIDGVSEQVLRQALAQALDARMQVMDVMMAAIAQPRAELSAFAPRMITIKIDPEKIGMVIGPGGKTVRSLQERHNVKIDIENEGLVFIGGLDAASVSLALEEIQGMTEDAEVGRIYTGKVKRIEDYGVFVEFLPGKDGMVHISQLSDHHVVSAADEVSLGDEIMVMVTSVDEQGKVRLSRQAVLEGWTAEEAREKDRRPSGGGGRDRGGDRGRSGGGDRGGDRGRSGGGDRGGDRGRSGGGSGGSDPSRYGGGGDRSTSSGSGDRGRSGGGGSSGGDRSRY
ncbi:MAG: polyribonucleotide nucleotidyltransferase [Phototrophicaceae bacterium]